MTLTLEESETPLSAGAAGEAGANCVFRQERQKGRYLETFRETIYWLLVLIPTEVEAGHRKANGLAAAWVA